MPRSRNIKPGFFSNEELVEVDPLGRLLFIGLWTLADREGRLEDRPKRIKMELLPCDNCDIDDLLNELSSHGFIERYEVDGKLYIQIINFKKHQNPHVREAASSIPASDKIAEQEPQKLDTCAIKDDSIKQSTVQAPCKNDADIIPAPTKADASHADSLLLIPDSFNTTTAGAREEIALIDEETPVFKKYSDNIHPITGSIEVDAITDLIHTHSAVWVSKAIDEAIGANVRNLKYISAILARWQTTGLGEPWTEKREKRGQRSTANNKSPVGKGKKSETDWSKETGGW